MIPDLYTILEPCSLCAQRYITLHPRIDAYSSVLNFNLPNSFIFMRFTFRAFSTFPAQIFPQGQKEAKMRQNHQITNFAIWWH